ncbi:MAG: glycosyltransferase family 1 protein [Candidatus Margulisiibacteriota bacterium]
MKIAVNAQLLNFRDFGIKTYLQRLTDRLLKIDRSNEYALMLDRTQSKSWEHLKLPGIVNKGKFDLFFSPDHILPAQPLYCKKVLTVHDLSFVKFPELFTFLKRRYKRLMTPVSLKRADRIIAVSQNTKNDIIDIYGTAPEKITVVHNGVGSDFLRVADKKRLDGVKNKYGLPDSYILFVGTIEPRKNIVSLVRAYKKSRAARPLVIAGKPGWLSEPIIKEIRSCDRVLWLDNVETQDLPSLYSMASIFVYPSLYEGFGLPVIEAMACGLAVITSNVSSLPEVAGNAAVLIDPKDTDTLAGEIIALLRDADRRDGLAAKALERAKMFSWEKCARETIKVYESCSHS